jgi:hypothetical protein
MQLYAPHGFVSHVTVVFPVNFLLKLCSVFLFPLQEYASMQSFRSWYSALYMVVYLANNAFGAQAHWSPLF